MESVVLSCPPEDMLGLPKTSGNFFSCHASQSLPDRGKVGQLGCEQGSKGVTLRVATCLAPMLEWQANTQSSSKKESTSHLIPVCWAVTKGTRARLLKKEKRKYDVHFCCYN